MKAAIEIKEHTFLKEDYITIYFDFSNETNVMQRFLTYMMEIENLTDQFIQYRMRKTRKNTIYIECAFKYDDSIYSRITRFVDELKAFGYEVEISN